MHIDYIGPDFKPLWDIIFARCTRRKNLKTTYCNTEVGQNQVLIDNKSIEFISFGRFLSMVQYYVGRKDNPKTKDEAMRQVAGLPWLQCL